MLAVPVIIILPPFFSKYKINQESTRSNANKLTPMIYFKDLNGDGTREIVEGFEYVSSSKRLHSLQYFSENGAIYDQINFDGHYNRRLNELFIGDLNRNNKAEIYGFTMQNDSLLLNVAEPFAEPEFQKSYFVVRINKSRNDLYDSFIRYAFFEDMNRDGTQEFVFTLQQGFSLLPKSIFVFSMSTESFEHTPVVGNNNMYIEHCINPENNEFEIVAGGSAGYTMPDTIDVFLSDDRPYLKVYNANLEFKFEPVPFPVGISGHLKSIPKVVNNQLFYFSFYFSRSAESPDPTLYKINSRGKKTDSLVFHVEQRIGGLNFIKNERENFYVLCGREKVFEVNTNLEIINEIKLKINGNFGLYADADINEDGIPEYILADRDNGAHYLATDHFKRFYPIGTDLLINSSPKISKHRFFTYDKNLTYIHSFKLNPYRFLAIPAYLFVYLLFAGVVWSVRKTQESRVKEKYKLQSQVRELQLKTFRNQLSPHFIFNTFNSIISVALQGDKEQAYNLFVKISNVLRQSLENTESIMISLKNELNLVKNFVAIQQFRFKNVFDFEMNIDEAIDTSTVLIPKMIIQIHVENAIKHGLLPKKENGKLKIDIQKNNKSETKIIIEDNGIGREEAKKLETGGTNLGLKTMAHFIREVNAIGKLNINQEITDKKDDEGKAAGTRVILNIKRTKKRIKNFRE
jgi:hypothetical protein